MSDTSELDALIDASAVLTGIEVRPEWRDSVRMHLDITLRHAATVLAFPLPDDTDPAPVFQA
jgi:hypothetical protein